MMIFYGLSNSLFSFISGVLEGLIGRVPLFIGGALLNLAKGCRLLLPLSTRFILLNFKLKTFISRAEN